MNFTSLRSPHKDLFVSGIHTSGHGVGPEKPCQTLALGALYPEPSRYGTCSASAQTESIENERDERRRNRSLCVTDRGTVYTASDRDKTRALATDDWLFHGRPARRAAARCGLFTGSGKRPSDAFGGVGF